MPSNIKGAAIASKASYCMFWCGMTKCYLYIGSRPLIQFLCDSLQSQGSVSNSSNSTKTNLFWSTKIFLPLELSFWMNIEMSIFYIFMVILKCFQRFSPTCSLKLRIQQTFKVKCLAKVDSLNSQLLAHVAIQKE